MSSFRLKQQQWLALGGPLCSRARPQLPPLLKTHLKPVLPPATWTGDPSAASAEETSKHATGLWLHTQICFNCTFLALNQWKNFLPAYGTSYMGNLKLCKMAAAARASIQSVQCARVLSPCTFDHSATNPDETYSSKFFVHPPWFTTCLVTPKSSRLCCTFYWEANPVWYFLSALRANVGQIKKISISLKI